jgi:FdrA protein
MATTQLNIRRGTYYDSVVLMQLQAALAKLPGVLDAGVVMGTPANKELLAQSGLTPPGLDATVPDDLIIVIKADNQAAADEALAQVDTLLTRRQSTLEGEDYLPQSLDAAAKMLPDARWVLISVPGRYAAGVARDALRLGKNVFLYSDNVSLEDEIRLKRAAADKGLLVMGPDCGTAIVNGVGLGFANRVRRGPIGIVGASGTGLQQVSARIHQLGSGISHAIGTGGRDLSESVGAISAMQALDLLARDPDTRVIVLISKPPSTTVAEKLLERARDTGKQVVVDFIGYAAMHQHEGSIAFAHTLDDAAEQAVRLAGLGVHITPTISIHRDPYASSQKYLRGLFSGGTLAYEALLILRDYLPEVFSNAPLDKRLTLANSLHSQKHSIVDLGEDEFTVGRLHPMMDNTLRIQRLMQEAADPETAVILLDVVLGYGAHSDPASELAPAIEQAKQIAVDGGRYLEVFALVVGTDEDPQDMAAQVERLKAAGVHVELSNETAVRLAGDAIHTLEDKKASYRVPTALISSVNVAEINTSLSAINVGLESFAESLQIQEAQVLHVRWKPPAGGNEHLMSILERMKAQRIPEGS